MPLRATKKQAGLLSKKRKALSSDDDVDNGASDNSAASSSSSDVAHMCVDCGKLIKPGQSRHKNQMLHGACGGRKVAIERFLKQSNPDSLAKLRKLRKDKPTKYRAALEKLGDKKKGQKLSSDMKESLLNVLDEFSREQHLASTTGFILLSKAEYIQHMKLQRGWAKKKAANKFKLGMKDDKSISRVVNGVARLGVEKPPEITQSDMLKLSQKASGPTGAVTDQTIQKISSGWGSASALNIKDAVKKGAHTQSMLGGKKPRKEKDDDTVDDDEDDSDNDRDDDCDDDADDRDDGSDDGASHGSTVSSGSSVKAVGTPLKSSKQWQSGGRAPFGSPSQKSSGAKSRDSKDKQEFDPMHAPHLIVLKEKLRKQLQSKLASSKVAWASILGWGVQCKLVAARRVWRTPLSEGRRRATDKSKARNARRAGGSNASSLPHEGSGERFF